MARPSNRDRKVLSEQDKQYCQHRAEGMDMHAAAKAIGRKPIEMRNLEAQWPLMQYEIGRLREEQFKVVSMSAHALYMKSLRNIYQLTEQALLKSELTPGEIESLLKSMDLIMAKIEAEDMKHEKKEKDDKHIWDFIDMTDMGFPEPTEKLITPPEKEDEPEDEEEKSMRPRRRRLKPNYEAQEDRLT